VERIDQNVLRQCINLSSSFLLTDVATNPGAGISTWSTGLNRLVDIVIVLHKRNELEVDTISAASKACSECWTIAGNWRGLDDCRQSVREIGGRLKKVLDPDEHTYGGNQLFVSYCQYDPIFFACRPTCLRPLTFVYDLRHLI
jgi:hypothetical protein